MPDKKTITLEEFLDLKRKEAREAALLNSYNSTKPRLAKKWYSKEDYDSLQADIEGYEYYLNDNEKDILELERKLYNPILLKKGIAVIKPEFINKNGTIKDFANGIINTLESLPTTSSVYKKHIKEYKDRLEFAKQNGYDWTGYNCITNASGWYGDPYVCASNIEFANNPAKYGFTEINPNEAVPGDIFQYNDNKYPFHATMFSKKDDDLYLSNYANGNWDEDIKHDSSYWGIGDRAYRFIGLPEDIKSWTQEYNNTYGEKKLGGMRKVRQKKVIGGIVSAVGSIANSFINAHNQARLQREQQEAQVLNQNRQNTNLQIANLNEIANSNMSWAYDRFRPSFKCGGKKRMKANLGKYKPRFDK